MRETRSQKRRRQAREYLEAGLIRGEDRAELLRAMQRDLEWAPSRSTFYAWAQQWDLARASDLSESWSLATDTTGRPAVVLRVLAGLLAYSQGRAQISVDDARWLVRLGNGAPDDWPSMYVAYGGTAERPPSVTPGPIRLYHWAVRCAEAERAGDTAALARLQNAFAGEYWFEDWHLAAWEGEQPELSSEEE